MKKFGPWVVIACLAGVTVLSALHADTSQIMIVITTVLGGVIYGKVDAVQQQSNGNLTRLISLIERQSEQLAAGMPPPTRLQPREGDEP